MLSWEDGGLPHEVQALVTRVARWRRQRVGRAHMPEDLWGEAMILASSVGAYRTAQVLGLSYSTVKRRLDAREASRVRADDEPVCPAFLEVLAPLAGGQVAECILEVESHGGQRLRVEMKGISSQCLVAVLQGLV